MQKQIISPFHGIRYNPERHRDLSALLAPPYDIITPEGQAELYAQHPRNFVRLELGRTDASDTEADNRYTRAAVDLQSWLREGDLVREQRPALYVVETEFALGGRAWRLRGVFAAVRLPEEDERYVLEHEDTFASAKQDRFRLMQATQAMISPVLSLCEDPERRLLGLLGAVTGAPDAEARREDVTHRMWVVRDDAAVAAFVAAVGGGPIYIADGHHRYLTARRHRDEMRQRHPQAPAEAGFNHALMLLLSAQDAAVKILPAHRLLSGLDLEGVAWVKSRMVDYFEVHGRELPPGWERFGAEVLAETVLPHRHVYQAYCSDGTFVDLLAREALLPVSESPVDLLDVSVLHGFLLDPILHCDPHSLPFRCDGLSLAYTVEAAEAAARVRGGECEFAFFLRGTRVDQVLAVARAGERMPHKSTYFYPKAPSGLVVSGAGAETI